MWPSGRTHAAIGLALGLVSNALILTAVSPSLRLLGGLLLFCVLPGYLWCSGLLPAAEGRAKWACLELFTIGIGLSMALSVLVVLALQWLPGEMSAGHVLLGNDLLILSGALAAILRPAGKKKGATPTEKLPTAVLIVLLLVVLLGGVLRVSNLGYAEFQDDEVDVVQVSMQAIQGDAQAVLNDTRGPARTMLAAAFFLYTNRVGEGDVRWPVALASIVSILVVFCLGRRLFGPTAGVLAASIVAVEGIVLGYGRIVQQESLVNLWAALAVLCFVLANRSPERSAAAAYRVAGVLMFAAGVLAHYEIVLITPLLLWLWIAGERSLRRLWPVAAVAAAVIVLVLGTFYVPFLLSPGFGETYQHYSSDILGRGLADNLGQFMLVTSFYNSIYLVVPLVLLLVFSYSHDLSRRSRRLGWFYGLGSLMLWGVSLIVPGQLPLLGLAWFGSLLVAVLVLSPGDSRGSFPADEHDGFKIAFAWLMLYFIPYLYIVGLPRMHYFTFSLPWALAAGYGLHTLWGIIGGKPLRIALAIVLGICYALAVYHGAMMFVSHAPEWAMVQPEKPLPLHPRLHSERPGEAFGFPQKSGWRAVENLYRSGELRGSYETNELHQKVDWYLRRSASEPGENRYYLVAESPHRLQAGPSPEPFVPDEYYEAGLVTVAGEPKLHIFERDNERTVPGERVIYRNEAYESAPGGVRSLDTYRLWWQYQASDPFYRDTARHLEIAAGPEDGIVLDHPDQAELLSAYYRGDLPYYALPQSGQPVEEVLGEAASAHPRLYALFWAVDAADPGRQVEGWLDQNTFKADDRWFGNVRLATYAAPGGPAGLMDHEIQAQLGSEIMLRGYSLQGGPFRGGDILPLRLFWDSVSVSGPVTGRYKVFVHVTGVQGQIVAQRDSEPAGGSRPTGTWLPGDRIADNQGVLVPPDLPAGRYQVAVGMYDPETGARLPAVDTQGQRLPDDRVPLGDVEIEGP